MSLREPTPPPRRRLHPRKFAPSVSADSALFERVRARIDDLAWAYPARMAILAFAALVLVIAGLLSLPISTATGKSSGFPIALFTATSAVCVTGLEVNDTASYWSAFGHTIIAIGMAIGGIGIMTIACALALAVSARLGLSQRIMLAHETQTNSLGTVAFVLKIVLTTAVVVQLGLFVVLFPRFLTLNESVPTAAGHAAFMSISIFNNAGFANVVGGLGPYVSDWWMVLPIIVGCAIGGLGFLVIHDVLTNWRNPKKWTLHTKLTLTTYALVAGIAATSITASEWYNPKTFGGLDPLSKMLSALLFSVNSRSLGLTTINIADMHTQSWFTLDALMFIGGGSASTAGGIKVTTLALMFLAIFAEARGDRDIEAFGRRIPSSSLRLALSVTLVSVGIVALGVLTVLHLTDYSLDVVFFEVISAFGSVGLSVGLSYDLDTIGKFVFSALMFAGRIGPITIAVALALRNRHRAVRMPEEAPSIG